MDIFFPVTNILYRGFYRFGGDEVQIEYFEVPSTVALCLEHLNLEILNPGNAQFKWIHTNKLHKKSLLIIVVLKIL